MRSLIKLARNFASDMFVFLASRAANNFADQLIMFAMPLLVYKTTNNVAWTAFTFFIEWIPRLIALPVSGVLVDRVGGRRLYLISDTARLLICIAIYFYVVANPTPSFIVLGLFGGIIGFFHEQAFIALEASIPRIAREHQISTMQSILQAIEHGAQILGPICAGLILYFWPIQSLFAVAGLLFFASLINAFRLTIGGHHALQANTTSMLSEIGDGLRFLARHPKLAMLTGITFYLNLILGAALAVTAGYIQAEFGKNETDYATLMTLTGVVALATFVILPAIMNRYSLHVVGFFSFILTLGAGTFLGLAHSYFVYAICLIILVGADGVFNVYIRTIRVRFIPPEKLGTVLGVIVLANLSAMPIGGLLVGLSAGHLTVGTYFLIISGFGVIPLILFKNLIPDHSTAPA